MSEITEKLKKTFIDLIKINEVFPDEREVVEYTTRRLVSAGFSVRTDAFGNIIAHRPGVGEPVLFSTHLDIPEPAPDVRYKIEGEIIRSDGSNILGADPKTGLAVIIEFCDFLKDSPKDTYVPIECVLTRGEEAGLIGALNLDYSMVSARTGLVLDEDGPVTQVVTRAPGFVMFDAVFHGKPAHPREPELGVNALRIAADVLERVPPGFSTEGVTWNPGLFEAGTARNSIPGRATLKAELRSFDTDLAVSESERIERVCHDVARTYGGSCEVTRPLMFSSYILSRKELLFTRLERTFGQIGKKPNYFETFGGSDANVFNAHGIQCVPVGSGYFDAHQYSEYADLQCMAELLQFLDFFARADV